MKNILTGPISQILFHADDPNDAPVESVQPDFSSLKGGGGGRSDDDIITVTEDPPKAKETVVPIEIDPKPEPKPEKKDQSANVPTPEIDKKKVDDKKPVEEKPPERKSEKINEPEPKKDDKKEEPPKPKTIPKDNSDLDKIQAKDSAPEAIKNAVRILKTTVIDTRAIAEERQQRIDALLKEKEEIEKKVGTVPEDVTKELEDLRQFRLMVELDGDPAFRAEYDAKVTSSEEQLLGFLKSHGLADNIIEDIKKQGVMDWPQWGELEKQFTSPLARQEMLNLLMQRRDVDRDRDKKISEIKTNKDGYIKGREEASKQETVDWANKAVKVVNKLGGLEKNAAFTLKDIPSDATKEQKEAIEKHNARATKLATGISEILPKIYARDPEVLMDRLLEASRASLLDEELESVKSELAARDTRISELEDKLASIRKAGNVTHVDAAPLIPAKPKPITEGTAEEALAGFMKEKGK